nr:anthrone oxygenase family protein [Hyphomonas sp. Mor2]
MPTDWIVYACLILGISSALVAGVLQSFSDFVMRGLQRAAPAGGIESMQQLNRTVYRSIFLTTFMLMVPVTIAFAIFAWFNLQGLPQRLIIGAAIVYVPSVFVVTAAGNVPMNERLDKLDHTSREAAEYWRTYGRIWSMWNTIRTIGAIVTSGAYLLAAVTFS